MRKTGMNCRRPRESEASRANGIVDPQNLYCFRSTALDKGAMATPKQCTKTKGVRKRHALKKTDQTTAGSVGIMTPLRELRIYKHCNQVEKGDQTP